MQLFFRLHGDNAITMGDYSEGELGILHSEIYKMTIRLREQQQKLMNDKVYLADSIADISSVTLSISPTYFI